MSDAAKAEDDFDPKETMEFVAQEIIDAVGLPLVISFKLFLIGFMVQFFRLIHLKRRFQQRYPAKRRDDASAIVRTAQGLRRQIEDFNAKWGLALTIDPYFAPHLFEFLGGFATEDSERVVEAARRAETEIKGGLAVGFKLQAALFSLDQTIEHFQIETDEAAGEFERLRGIRRNSSC